MGLSPSPAPARSLASTAAVHQGALAHWSVTGGRAFLTAGGFIQRMWLAGKLTNVRVRVRAWRTLPGSTPGSTTANFTELGREPRKRRGNSNARPRYDEMEAAVSCGRCGVGTVEREFGLAWFGWRESSRLLRNA